MSLLGWPLALCPDCRWNSSSEFLPDPPSLLLHLILCPWSWVMAPPALTQPSTESRGHLRPLLLLSPPRSPLNMLLNPKSTHLRLFFPLPSHCHNLDLAFHSFLQELLTHYLPTPISLTPNPFFTQCHGNNFSRRPI